MNVPAQPDSGQLRRLLLAVGPDLRLVIARPMEGGVSAATTFIEAQSTDGERQRFVLRQHGVVPGDDPRSPRGAVPGDDPRSPRGAVPGEAGGGATPHLTAADEYRLLGRLRAAGIPVPRPRLAAESGTILAGPFVLMEFVDGAPVTGPPEPAAFTGQLAAVLAKLHNAAVARTDVPFLPDIQQVAGSRLATWPGALDESVSEAAIRAVLPDRWPPPLRNDPRLLHGDYWPGNTLWRDGQLVALIDWEDAAFGDPLADVSNARLELAMAFGADAVHDFTRQYRAARPEIDVTALPHWDLYAALRPAGELTDWGLAAAELDRFRAGHRAFTRSALELL